VGWLSLLFVVLAAAVAGGLLLFGSLNREEPVHVTDPPVPSASDAVACNKLAVALPDTIGDGLKARKVTPSSPYLHAWGKPGVVLRCGVGYPPNFNSTSLTGTVDGIFWFPTQTGDAVIYTTVQRTPRVSVAVPSHYGQSFDLLTSLSQAIKATTIGT
jgi:hypothetical protein